MVLLLSIGIVAIVMALLCIKIILVKGGKFPNSHISGNKGLNSRGITCASSMDRMEQKQNKPRFDFKQYNHAIQNEL